MGIWLCSGLQLSEYWQEVRLCGDHLLKSSPLHEWTIWLRPKTSADADEIEEDQSGHCDELWYAKADPRAKEVTVGVPPDACKVLADADPRATADFIVDDLLPQVMPFDEGDVSTN